jgi:hypothetical protein
MADHYVSTAYAIVSQLMLHHVGSLKEETTLLDLEEWCLLGSYAVWLL